MAKVKTPLNQPSLNTIESMPILDIESTDSDSQNVIKGKAVVLIDPLSGKAFTMPLATLLYGATTPTLNPADVLPIGVTQPYVNKYSLETIANMFISNPGGGSFEPLRAISWIAHADCTTVAATPIKAATIGKKHRILGGVIVIAAGALAAGIEAISILDVAADIGLDFSSYIPAAAGILGVSTVIPFDLKQNGWLCAAVNTAINVTLSLAITAGQVSVTLWGCDE
jgi:hypothetical protein